jgi:hypothetical protein
MDRTTICVPGLILLLVASILIAGCSTSETTDTAAQTATPASTGPLFKAGDIVRNPSSTATSAWLVIGYDAASDTYERALIYQNADGSWGYRADDRTEEAKRLVMEKVYTEILTNKRPSSVPIVTPTTIAPEETTWASISVAATTKPTAFTRPAITSIIPDEGYTGTSVSIKNLAGENFVAGTTVALSRNGSTSITATDVRIVTNKSIICTFAIPSDAAVGAWDVIVRNPDGQSVTFSNIFTVHRDMNAATTTSPVSAGTVPITYIDPPFAFAKDYKEFFITGSKFQNGATVKLLKDGKTNIVGTDVRVTSDTQIRCFFDIPYESAGTWDILVTNPDQTYGRRFGGFEVRG